jgi:hypothetical protein
VELGTGIEARLLNAADVKLSAPDAGDYAATACAG